MKRFYDFVSVRSEGDGFAVVLDARVLKTPAGNRLVLPSRRLAEAVAHEWEAQADRIMPETMPLTRLVNTAAEQIAPRPAPVIESLADYGATDLLCHWAEYPDELVIRQRNAWQPILDWAASTLGIRLQPVAGIRPRPQEAASLDALRRHLEALDPLSLAAAHMAASVTGSVILTLALAYGRLGTDETWRVSRIDEDFQIEKWGEDAEGNRLAVGRHEALRVAATVLEFMRPQPAGGSVR